MLNNKIYKLQQEDLQIRKIKSNNNHKKRNNKINKNYLLIKKSLIY